MTQELSYFAAENCERRVARQSRRAETEFSIEKEMLVLILGGAISVNEGYLEYCTYV